MAVEVIDYDRDYDYVHESSDFWTLAKEIQKIPGIEKLKFKPEIWNEEVGGKIARQFERVNKISILAFIEPWGYKGPTLKLVRRSLIFRGTKGGAGRTRTGRRDAELDPVFVWAPNIWMGVTVESQDHVGRYSEPSSAHRGAPTAAVPRTDRTRGRLDRQKRRTAPMLGPMSVRGVSTRPPAFSICFGDSAMLLTMLGAGAGGRRA